MYWLVIDTSQSNLAAGLVKGVFNQPDSPDTQASALPADFKLAARTKSSRFEAVSKKDHSHTLLSAIDLLLKSQKLKPHDLTGIMAGLGPGSFTGTRVGAATVRAAADFSNILAAGFSLFHSMLLFARASNILDPLQKKWPMAVYARKNLYYQALMTFENNRPCYIDEPFLGPLEKNAMPLVYSGVPDDALKNTPSFKIEDTPFTDLVRALYNGSNPPEKDFQNNLLSDWEKNIIPMYLQKPLAVAKNKCLINKPG
jgi:tRNA threonylcarbamoyl adenosine modification protein YeaZ